jgi:hypothetical protein
MLSYHRKFFLLVTAGALLFVLIVNYIYTTMSTECIEIEGEPYPQTSELLKLTDCLDSECNKVGDTVIIETKINTVQGIIRYIDGKQVKVGYSATDAGYTPCYKLSQCEIISLRCYSCCDDRYFDLGSCDLTEETITAALGMNANKLVGNIFLYNGDINDPDCKYKYSGFGPIEDPVNWYDTFGNLAAQFEQLEGQNLATFLAWLASVFEGNGITFNVHEDGDKIMVTVGGGSGGTTSSFSFNYSNGTIIHNPGDGSGNKTANIILKQPNAPSEPYNWFLFVNTNTNALFVNNGGEAMLLGFLEDGEPTTCSDVIGCIVTNFSNGPLDPDRWALPEMVGPTWRIEYVTYGSGPTIVDYSSCSGSDFSTLVLNLNGCPNNPIGWEWINNGGVLTLCTPVGTSIQTIVYINSDNDIAIKNFAGIPTVAGEAGTDLCQEIAQCVIERGLLNEVISNIPSIKFSSTTSSTESEIEIEFSSMASGVVYWTGPNSELYTGSEGSIRCTLNTDRRSTKLNNGTWIHHVEARVDAQNSNYVFGQSVSGSTNISSTVVLDLNQLYGVPIDVKKIFMLASTQVNPAASSEHRLELNVWPVFNDGSVGYGHAKAIESSTVSYTSGQSTKNSCSGIIITPANHCKIRAQAFSIGLNGVKDAKLYVVGWEK